MGKFLQVITFGESHGKGIGCVVENCPAGLPLTETDIQPDLDRRKPGQSKLTTQRKEPDTVSILSGTFNGITTGSPIAMVVYNKDQNEKDYSELEHIFRPSHADFTYQQKYGHRAHTGGGRSSARTAIGTVAAGAVAKKILKTVSKIKIAAFVASVHNTSLPENFILPSTDDIFHESEKNPVRCPDQTTAAKMEQCILEALKSGDSVGGVIDLIIENAPAGLGSPVFDKLDALLAYVMMGIPAVKGVEIGSGFQGTHMRGSEHNDAFFMEDGKVRTRTNFSGGIQGGITNGEPIYMRIAFKPTATIRIEQNTVNDKGEDVLLKASGRHDPCVLPRAVPIVEASAALVIADQYLINKLSKINQI